MIILSGIVLVLLIICVPYILGTALFKMLHMKATIKMGYGVGWLVMLALFEAVTVPLTFAERSLTEVTWIYTICIMLLCGLYFGICIWKKEKSWKYNFNIPGFNLYAVFAILFFLLQIVVAVFGVHMDADDAYYIGTANTSLSTDTLFLIEPDTGYASYGMNSRYAFSALMVFWAYLSRITGIHPLIITHTIIPVVFISISYILWWEVGKCLLKENEKRWVFFLLVNVINVFGNTSVYTQSSFMLFRIWQGKALLPNIILPSFLYFFLKLYGNIFLKKQWFAIFVTVLAACCCSSMAVPLGTMVVGTGTCVLVLAKRDWKIFLYGLMCCIPCLVIGICYLII